jgi:hypothetical protein
LDEEPMSHKRRYLSYLLRLWQARAEEGMVWRASLEGARAGEQVGFSSLEELFRFLENEACEVTEEHTGRGAGGKGGDIDG